MPVQITIIGLGQIGASVGLALKARGDNFHILGHDKDLEAAKAALAAGAVDAYKINLPDSVRDAQVVVVALPFSEVRETLAVIALDLQENAVVLDTALSKGTVAAWARELIPQGRFYAGLFPAIHPDHLHETGQGVKAARADLFERSVTVAALPQGTPESVFKLATDFISLLGSKPLFMDIMEADGLVGKVHILPQLAAAALLDATLDKPGWQEARKLAGRPYAAVTAGAAYNDDADSLREVALEDRENTVRLLNAYITSLVELRDEIEDGDRHAIGRRLQTALDGRNRWLDERARADWTDRVGGQNLEGQSMGERLSQMFFGSGMGKRDKQRK
jgi:prephenate dehydrogenase